MERRPLLLQVAVEREDVLPDLARVVGLAGQGNGDVQLMLVDHAMAEQTPFACLKVRSNIKLDQDLVHRIERLNGIGAVELRPKPAAAYAQ